MWNKVPKREYIRGNGYAPKKNPDKIINKGVIYDPMGQWKYPGEVTKIPGNTMATHGYGNIPLWVVPDNDPARLVQPNSGQQVFPNSTNFTEYPQLPIAQTGGVLLPGAQGKWLDSVNAQFNNQYGGDPSIPKLNQMKKGGWLEGYSKQTKLRGDRGYTSKNIKTSINKLMLRNETLFGPKGKKIYDPLSKFQPGGAYNMERALELGYQPDETDHWPSVDYENGMWLKSKKHPTAWMEYMYGHALNPELNKNTDVIINPEGYFGNNQLQYVPKKQMGGEGWLEQYQPGGPKIDRSLMGVVSNPSETTQSQAPMSKYAAAEQNKAAVKAAIEGHAETAYNKHLQREELKKKYPTKNQEEIQRIQDKIESPLFYEPAGQLASYATRFHGLTDDEIARITGSGTMGDRLGVAANMGAWALGNEIGGKAISNFASNVSPYIKEGAKYINNKLSKFVPKELPGSSNSFELFDLNNVRKPSGSIGNQGATPEGARDILKSIGIEVKGVKSGQPTFKEMVEHLKNNPKDASKYKNFLEKEPINVSELPGEEYQINDGHHRATLGYYSGMENIPAIIKNKGEYIKKLPGSPNAALYESKTINPIYNTSSLPKELEPYLSKKVIPASNQDQVFESFLSPEMQQKKAAQRIINYDKQGNIIQEGLGQEPVKSGFDFNFITKPLTPFTKNELTKIPGQNMAYRKIGNQSGLQDLINKKGAQAPAPMRMKSGLTADTPFFGMGKTPSESYKGMYAVEVDPFNPKYNWSSRVAGTDNYGVAPYSKETGELVKNIPLEDLNVYRKKWFSNNYKKLDPNNLEEALKYADAQYMAENAWKWGVRGLAADQFFNDGKIRKNITEEAKKQISNLKQKKQGGQSSWLNKYS